MDLIVDVSPQMDGYNFVLNPLSKFALDKLFPERMPFGKVFVAHTSRQSFEQEYGPVVRHILLTILGLAGAKLPQLRQDFSMVRFVNPRTHEELYRLALRDVEAA